MMSAKMELYWDAFEASTLEQPDIGAMASVAGSIQDLADASGRQESDAALQARTNLLDEGKDNISTRCFLNLMQTSRVIQQADFD